MSGVHPEFAEHVRAGLVNPQRNVRRALAHLTGDPGLRPLGLDFLQAAQEQLAEVSRLVDEENERHVHRCSCGHVHYVQGDEA